MKIIFLFITLSFTFSVFASKDLEKYISSFTYESRKEMKMHSKTLINLIKAKRVLLVDIRFKEEYQTWNVKDSINIPLSELPKKLSFLKKQITQDKLLVTACPHKDRAIIGMTYLRSHGIEASYLVDGLIGLMENLRGDNAKELQDSYKR